MRKSDLLRHLGAIPGDPEVSFKVDYEVCPSDDQDCWFTERVKNISLKTLYEYNDLVYDDLEILEDDIAAEKDGCDTEGDDINIHVNNIVNSLASIEKVVISLGV